MKPGERLSLQKHHHRSEHWVVVSGTAKVTCGDHEHMVNVNESTFIPIGRCHRLENPGLIPLVIIEVQSGEYLGEDDIIRFKDDYQRVEDETSSGNAGYAIGRNSLEESAAKALRSGATPGDYPL